MKRILSLALLICTLMSLCAVFSACGNEASIRYGEKYIYKTDTETTAIVFKKDGTGYLHRYKKLDTAGNFMSATRNFLWTATSDGTIHLVADGDTIYDEGSYKTDTVSIIKSPICFSEDLLYYDADGGSYTIRYRFLREGSELYEAAYED